jgi:hypothetical protein
MRRPVATIAALSLLACTSGAAAGVHGRPPPFPNLPGNWSHAEINVKIKGSPHTLILDHGRITQASLQQVTLREPDGSIVTIGLNPSTIVAIGKRTSSVFSLRRRQVAETMRIDDGAAVRVRVTLRP